MTSRSIDPPEGITEEVLESLRESSDRQLREIIHYAQELLHEPPSESAEIVPREGEEIVRIDDSSAYTLVVVERPDETGEAHGPFLYRVTWEPDVDGGGGRYRWHYLGRVWAGEEGE